MALGEINLQYAGLLFTRHRHGDGHQELMRITDQWWETGEVSGSSQINLLFLTCRRLNSNWFVKNRDDSVGRGRVGWSGLGK